MKSILALDASSSVTGWTFGWPNDGLTGSKPIGGHERFARDHDVPDEVFRRAGVWLNDQITVLRPDIVAIEAPILTSGGGFTNPHTADLLQGIIHVFRFVVKCRLPGTAHLIAAATVRKTFCGTGRFAKGEAKPAVQQECIRRGWLTAENMQADRADSQALWCHMAAQQIPELAFQQMRKRA